MPRRTHREFGQIDRQRSGRYRARFTGPDGRLVTAPHTFATKREATDYLARVRGELLAGNTAAVIPTRITVAEAVATYLRTNATRLRPRTLDLYRRTAERWILRPVGTDAARIDLGPLPLSTLTTPLLREWHTALTHQAHAEAVGHAQRSATRRATRSHPARAWARQAGYTVAPTGRLSPAILDAWHAAGSPGPAEGAVPETAGRTAAAQAYRLLRAVLNQAASDGLIPHNPARVKGAGQVDHPERLPLSAEEVSALAAAVPAELSTAVLVAAWSGLRPGELFALRRTDVDTTARTVTVRRALVEVPGSPITYGPPKSAAGRRTVSLPESVAAALADHLAEHTGPGAEALVFATPAGGPWRGADRTRALRRAREAIGRPDATWHHLRHTGATLAAIAGATQAELQARIGHSTPRAAAIYQHARADRDRWIADQLDALATPGPVPPSPSPEAPSAVAPAPDPLPTAQPAPAPAAPTRRHLSLVRSA
ncbi:site-specific integrase [Brachybacterium vulturis]|uniref:Site-specific integrase n=1 Tax=Brachybacterium vulturis TaxID=2017484 RepID=A0A291GR24_9MICO|nr:tyrosine-type recombinase/integrase [Brachybacterium vulturis]ATG52637.1 site-specific integrase [Brachybacterium vulturis]